MASRFHVAITVVTAIRQARFKVQASRLSSGELSGSAVYPYQMSEDEVQENN